MNRQFCPNPVRPNMPLRKPTSGPVVVPATMSPPLRPTGPRATLRPMSAPIGGNPLQLPVSMDQSALLRSPPPALSVCYCNYCGHQGNFQCKRCKKMPYCSVACQMEDWKAHRHVCKAADPEPAREKPKDATCLPVVGDRDGQLESKHADASSAQRMYLKDLNVAKTITGTGIQATVVEFYNPGRFYLLAQSPETLEALQVISTKLKNAYSCAWRGAYAPHVGEVCGVQFSCDLNWYRGLVQTLSPDQRVAKVLYIDFGNEEDVPVDRIRPLAADIQPFCPCAMECRVTGVVPPAGVWSPDCCIAVKKLLSGKTVTVNLTKTLENGLIHVVDVLLSTGENLSTFLVRHGYAAEEAANVKPTKQEINAAMSASLENVECCSSGKFDSSWTPPPEPLTQVAGDSFAVVVTYFQSPSEMIVQKVENAGKIQELQLNLREYCCQVAAPQSFRPAPGSACCAQFSEDKQWYRAKVLAYPSEERVCVCYFDFGNSEVVDLGHLRPISTSLLALPMQAMCCGLAGVKPVGERWSDDCLLALRRRVANRILHVEVMGTHDGKILVAMTDKDSDPQADVTELLISAGYAAPAPVATCSTSSDHQVDQTGSSAEPTVSTPACEPVTWSFMTIPCEGQKVVLFPTFVENPGQFFCRVDNPADRAQMMVLAAELKQHCQADDAHFEPRVGEPCCAIFPGDGSWHRAIVKEVSENQVSVNYVDHGCTMQVERHHLRSIKPQLLTLPFQAVRCWLPGVEPLGSEWSSEAMLWFQSQVAGEQLSARVVSVTDQGYGVEVESRGQNVAAALVSEKLAKGPGQIAIETQVNESVKETERGQTRAQTSTETVVPTQGPSFLVGWKTAELPLNETFKPCIAAVMSPSLFYVLAPSQAGQEKLQLVMMEVAAFCSNNQASLSSAAVSRPAPGAACCAQFSADNIWYRAVVLDVSDNEIHVIYADYGNTETLPSSRILPIPMHLLQLPFHITRCTLTGQEHFPGQWPDSVQQMFRTILMNGVLATVQSFDGSANVLSLSAPAESGGGDVTAMIVDALQLTTTRHSDSSADARVEETDRSAASAGAATEPDCPQPKSTAETPKELQHTAAGMTSEPVAQCVQQSDNTPAKSHSEDPVQKIIEQMEPPALIAMQTNDPQTSGCCCLRLETKIDHLEQLMQLQLSLLKRLAGQTAAQI